MEDLCPLCLKNGTKKKVKLLQINLQEAVWMCEEEKCPWPFGYKGFIFCPRIVGKIWSCYWDDHKSTAKLKEAALSPINQQSFCNSPATLIKTVSTDCNNTLNLITNHLENINSFSPTKINSGTDDSQTFLCKKSEIFSNNNEDSYANNIVDTNDTSVINNNSELVNNETKNTEIKNECITESKKIFQKEEDSFTLCNSIVTNNSLQLVNDETENMEVKNECINASKKTFQKEEDSCTQNNSIVTNNSLQLVNSETKSAKMKNECINASKKIFEEETVSCPRNNKNVNVVRIPKIRSIEKTNINILKIERNQIFVHQNINEKLSAEKTTDVKSKKYLSNDLSVSDKLVNSESAVTYSCDKKIPEIKSNVNVSKVKVDGLPTITLSFEVPTCTTVSKTIVSNLKDSFEGDVAFSNTKLSSPTTKNTLVKRKIDGKQYEKFSFSNIKKQLEKNNSNNTNNSNNKMTNNIENRISDKIYQSNKTIGTYNSNSEKSSISTDDSHKNISQHANTSTANNSINIDTVLDDLLSNDYSISEEINDDWINSLLT